MTRFKRNQKWSAPPYKFYSQRYLRIMKNLQEKCVVVPATPDDTVVDCHDDCKIGQLCLGRDWHKHRECYEN
ncbi:MAG: hypothetical protein JRL30_20300 [Deltaproteobacteria bacterium]|nr:hypothetical protein [Deltaproteobacteria bacterium]